MSRTAILLTANPERAMADAMADQVATEVATEGAAPAAWSRADTLKALEANEHVEAKPAAKADEAVEEPEADGDEAEAAPDDADEESDGDDAAEGESDADADADDEDAEPEVKADPDLAARLAKVQTAERRAREQLARERQTAIDEVARERAAAKADIDAAKEFAKLRESSRYDLAPLLQVLGISEGDYMLHARALAAMAPENKADPKNRDMVERLARERRMADDLAATKKRLDDFEAQKKAEAQRAENERNTQAYLDAVVAVKLDAPLARAALKADPDATRRELAGVALEMLEASGEPPEHAAVLTEYERRETKRLKRLGIDPATVAKKPAAKPDDKAPPNGKKPAAAAAAKKPAPKKDEPPPNETQAQRRARIQKALEEGNLDFD